MELERSSEQLSAKTSKASAKAVVSSKGMLIEASRDDLLNALSAVAAAQNDSELGWVQFRFLGDGCVRITSVSHNMSIRSDFKAQCSASGSFKVSGKQLVDYIKQLPPQTVTLSVGNDAKLHMQCGRSHARLQLVDDDVDIDVLVPDLGSKVVIRGEVIERWVNSFREFVAVEDTRFYANGANISIEESNPGEYKLVAVSTDSMRLAKCELTELAKFEKVEKNSVLVPRKALDELRRVCSLKQDEDFVLRWDQENLFFAIEATNYMLVSKCIAGTVPNYSAAIPEKIETQIAVPLRNLIESVRRLLLFMDKGQTIKLRFEENAVELTSFTPGLKEGHESIEIDAKLGNPFDVNYNGYLLNSILNVISGTEVRFSWQDFNRPVKIEGEPQRGLNVFYLLVPTRY